MIRVLHVIKAMDRAGAETMIMNLYRCIDRSKVQFDFLVHVDRRCDFDDEIEALGGRIYRLPLYNLVNEPAYRRLCRAFFAEHPEHPIVHGHLGSSAAIYLDEANRAGRFTIAHSHNTNSTNPAFRLAFSLVSWPTKHIAKSFMACSREAGLDRFGAAVVEGRNFTVVANGIDVGEYTCTPAEHNFCKQEHFGGGGPLFGHVGRFVEQKNHPFLLETFAHIRRQLPDARLALVGRGPDEEKIRTQAQKLGLADAVLFLGVRDDVPQLMKAFDVFIFPSVFEGLGIVLIEAQAAGLPCVASSAIPPIAFIAPEAARLDLNLGPEAWADECVKAYRNRPQRHDNANLVRRQGFDVQETAAWLSDFYQQHA